MKRFAMFLSFAAALCALSLMPIAGTQAAPASQQIQSCDNPICEEHCVDKGDQQECVEVCSCNGDLG